MGTSDIFANSTPPSTVCLFDIERVSTKQTLCSETETAANGQHKLLLPGGDGYNRPVSAKVGRASVSNSTVLQGPHEAMLV